MTPTNAFADLTITFGDAASHMPSRNPNSWVVTAQGPDWVLWQASAPDDTKVKHVRCSGWRLWALTNPCRERPDEGDLCEMADALRLGRSGPDFPAPFTLVFALDDSTGTWHVITDRFGTTHAYIGSGTKGTIVSTFSPTAAACGSKALDWTGIAGFCSFGFFPADRTWWSDVKIIRPATWLTIREGRRLTMRRYWNWWYEPESRPIADMTNEIKDSLGEIGDETARGKQLVLPISGGLDSRLLAGVLAEDNNGRRRDNVRGFTYGYGSSSTEIALAAGVGRAAGLRMEELVMPTYLLDQLDTVVDATEGFTSLTQPRQAGAADLIHRLGDVVVGGHWGDVWFDTSGTSGSGTRDELVGAAVSKFTKPGSRWLIENLCGGRVASDHPDHVLRDLLADEMALIPDLGDADMTLKALKTEQWSFRWTLASVRAYQLGASVALPFYDNRFVDLMLTIPSEQHAGRHLQQEVLRREYPDLAALPWQQTGRNLISEPLSPFLDVPKRAIRKAFRMVTRSYVVERNWEVQLRAPNKRQQLDSLLLEGPIAELVPPASTRELLRRFDARVDPAAGYSVDMLLTIAAWLRRFGG